MSTEERTRTDDAGTESRIEPTESYHGDDATRVLDDAATDELVGRPLHATLLPIGDAARDEPCPYNGTIVGRDDDHRIRLRDGGAVRCAKPEKLDHVELGPQVDRGDGPIPDGGAADGDQAEPPMDLDFDPVGDLSGPVLVDQLRDLNRIVWEGPFIERDGWREAVNGRQTDVWMEIRRRADTDEPECPECAGQRWGASPGEPPACQECGRRVPSIDTEEAIFDAWSDMRSEVDDE